MQFQKWINQFAVQHKGRTNCAQQHRLAMCPGNDKPADQDVVSGFNKNTSGNVRQCSGNGGSELESTDIRRILAIVIALIGCRRVRVASVNRRAAREQGTRLG